MDTSVSTVFDTYQELVLEEWAQPDAARAWHQWLPKQIGQFSLASDALAQAAGVQAGDTLLDLGSGAGDPALTFAELVGPTGRVVATDLVEAMVEACRENVLTRGVKNVESRQADAQALPFADETFDRVTSKLGAMYFADLQRSLTEIHRVLRPGGKVAFACWGPPEQSPYIIHLLGPFTSRVEMPVPVPGVPHPFRFAQPGTLAAELERAGFRDVEEQTRIVPMPWAGPPEEVWQNFYDVAIPVRALIDSFDPVEREIAVGEVLAGLRQYYDGTYTSPPAAFVVGSGTR
jgi:ubiquinone/menaquinone biosynthesis C-methylase UbiE